MIMSSCLMKPSVKPSLNDTVVELNDELNERMWDIDGNLLRYCQKAIKLSDGDLVNFKLHYDEIAYRFEECYILQKSLVDTINTIKNNNK